VNLAKRARTLGRNDTFVIPMSDLFRDGPPYLFFRVLCLCGGRVGSDGCADQCLESGCVDLLAFVDVYGSPSVSFKA